MTKISRIVVAMSGGVDSSVAAALLAEQGYDVVGVMMRLWDEAEIDGESHSRIAESIEKAGSVADRFSFPFIIVDVIKSFKSIVINYFKEQYARGLTPNPCMICNEHIKWRFLLDWTFGQEASHLATGHYVRLRGCGNGRFELLRGRDYLKDQAYFLSRLSQEQLSNTIFPLGNYHKKEVRRIAHSLGLDVADRSESQDLCFLGDLTYRQYLNRYMPEVAIPGPIINRHGEYLGQHRGLAFFTIGQRKGIKISSPHPLYVLKKDTANNSLIVGPKEDLGRSEMIVSGMHWIADNLPDLNSKLQVKIRYRADFATASIHPIDEDTFGVWFDQPVRDITPGQFAVFYNGDIVLGSGIIQPEGIMG